MFGEEGQKRIHDTHVGIVGLGGIGSQVVQGLAYLGAGSFVLVDDDYADTSNLNRLVGAVAGDAESERPKVAIAEEMICRINPTAVVQPIRENLRARGAFNALLQCKYIFGCVDGDGPRLVMTELAAAYGKTLIDSATEIILTNGRLQEYGGRVIVARPGDFCLDCAKQLDMETAKQELETSAVRQLRRAHGYGLGRRAPAASVISLNGVIANIAITEFLVTVTGIREPNRHLTYYGIRGVVNSRNDRRRDDCYVCGYVAGKGDQANVFRYVQDFEK